MTQQRERARFIVSDVNTKLGLLILIVTRCPPYYPPSNGQVQLGIGQGSCENNVIYGSECVVSCGIGYRLSKWDSDSEDEFTASCNRSSSTTTVGYWSEAQPICNGEFGLICKIPLKMTELRTEEF